MSPIRLVLRDDQGALRVSEADVRRLTIGRDPDCALHLQDRSVSREHLVLERGDDGLLVAHDRGSRAGTWVNGARIHRPTEIEDGDWIRVGNCLLVVRSDGVPPVAEDEAFLKELARHLDMPGAGTRDAPDGSRTATAAEGPAGERVVLAVPALTEPADETVSSAHLPLLAEITHTLRSTTSLDDQLTMLLGFAFDLLGPERGAVLIRDPLTLELESALQHPEDAGAFVNRSILERAMAERSTLAVVDVENERGSAGAANLEPLRSRTVICCPMIHRDESIGAIYLDTRFDGLRARRDEIGLLNLIACYAAASIENAQLLDDRRRARHLADLDEEPMVAHSSAMKSLLETLAARARSADPLWLEGETGTGKLLAARHVHVEGRGADAPFLALDCQRLTARDLRQVLFGDESSGVSARSALQSPRGAWHDTLSGTLVLEHVDAMDRISQDVLARALEQDAAAGAPRAPRLVVTSTRDLVQLSRDKLFSVPLAERLAPHRVRMPRLRDRREDVLVLARHFLHRADHTGAVPGPRLGKSAERVLEASKFKESNVRELRDAIELAATLSGQGSIEAEHVFTGPVARNHRLELDVGGSAPVRWLIRRPVHRALRVAVTLLFMTILVACLVVPGSTQGHFANDLVWGAWWPALLVVFVLIGRAWCAVCPLSQVSRWLQRWRSWEHRPPQWIKDGAPWIMAGLFLVIVWSEHVFDMPHRPLATGIFLLSLLAIAALTAVLSQREVWCRFACPLGNLSAAFSVPSTVHVHANPAICTSQCRTHECYKGSDAEEGCSMFLHPLYLKDAHFCKLCLACVRNCPNGSARVWVRPPLQDTWSLAQLNVELLPLSWTVFWSAPLLAAAHAGTSLLTGTAGATLAALMVAALAFATRKGLTRWFDRGEECTSATRIGFAMLVLAWGPLMAFHLGNVPGLENLVLQSRAVGGHTMSILAESISLLPLLQIGAIALATAAAGVALWRIRRRTVDDGNVVPTARWWVLASAGAVYAALATSAVL